MTSFAMLTKSYLPDLAYAERLVTSFSRHNVDGVDLFMVTPDEDLEHFGHLSGDHVSLLAESTFADHLVSGTFAGFPAGYINQEIVKLAFWETSLADNYLCLDSDAEFIRDFRVTDFMADDRTPYTFLTEDAELRVEPDYYRQHWAYRERQLRKIQETIGLSDDRLLTVHGHAVFSAHVLRSFRDHFLAPRGWDYSDALAIAAYEPTWYSLWLQHDRTIPIIPREPIIKTFHNPVQHLDYVLRGVTTEDAARGYVAVVVNSNYSRGDGVVSLADSPESALASYVDTGQLLRAMGYRAYRRIVVDKVPYRRTRTALGRWATHVPGLRNYVDLGDPR